MNARTRRRQKAKRTKDLAKWRRRHDDYNAEMDAKMNALLGPFGELGLPSFANPGDAVIPLTLMMTGLRPRPLPDLAAELGDTVFVGIDFGLRDLSMLTRAHSSGMDTVLIEGRMKDRISHALEDVGFLPVPGWPALEAYAKEDAELTTEMLRRRAEERDRIDAELEAFKVPGLTREAALVMLHTLYASAAARALFSDAHVAATFAVRRNALGPLTRQDVKAAAFSYLYGGSPKATTFETTQNRTFRDIAKEARFSDPRRFFNHSLEKEPVEPVAPDYAEIELRTFAALLPPGPPTVVEVGNGTEPNPFLKPDKDE